MPELDIIVVGGGHAGIEAALAASRMGSKVAMVVGSVASIGRMSCNPAIGGVAKGQLVREVDALGGQMGLTADQTGIHFRMLNTSKGAAVRSPRCQSDKNLYSQVMGDILKQSSCQIVEAMVEGLEVKGSELIGVRLFNQGLLRAKKVIICSGTFMNGLIHRGSTRTPAGRIDEAPSVDLPAHLRELGFKLARLKTGTPPRIHVDSMDLSRMEIQHDDEVRQPFSFRTAAIDRPRIPCYITYTNPKTHSVIQDHLQEIPLYNGQINGVGPRYCPSIEDKVFRFPDKDRHQIFVEPEGSNTPEVYLNGISSSISEKLQDEVLKTIPGLENSRVIRYGYAIEYDFCPPQQIFQTMETRKIPGLYFAGQINGTTGYEEAAAQGLMAGINAVLSLRGSEPFIPKRHEAYIGVLTDDLITKEISEPYRMFTSRAEYRLILRQDNADRRLMHRGFELGLVCEKTYTHMQRKYDQVEKLETQIKKWRVAGSSCENLLKQPNWTVQKINEQEGAPLELQNLDKNVEKSLEIAVKYSGYIQREKKRVERMLRREKVELPRNIDYLALSEMRLEGREKLQLHKPVTLEQAGRIAGVNPADIQILEIYLKRRYWPVQKKA